MLYDSSPLNETVVDVFGVDCTVNGVEVSGIYESPHRGVTAGGYPIEVEDYSLTVITEDLDPTGAEEGDRVIIGTEEFTIVAVKPDYEGMTALTLAKYA